MLEMAPFQEFVFQRGCLGGLLPKQSLQIPHKLSFGKSAWQISSKLIETDKGVAVKQLALKKTRADQFSDSPRIEERISFLNSLPR